MRPPVIVSQPEADSPISLVPSTPAPVGSRPAASVTPAPDDPGSGPSDLVATDGPPSLRGQAHELRDASTRYRSAKRFIKSPRATTAATGASAKVQVIYEANRDVMKSAWAICGPAWN